jgi:hypothetical protein
MPARALLLLVVAFVAGPAAAAEVELLIRFGLNDEGNTRWDGRVGVAPGNVERIDGWRFLEDDRVIDAASWKASTRPLMVHRAKIPTHTRAVRGNVLMADNGVFVLLRDVTESSRVEISTARGDFAFDLASVPYGQPRLELDGAVAIERVPAARPLASAPDDDAFPAIATGKDGAVHAAWVSFTPGLPRDSRAQKWTAPPDDFSFLAKPPGGDRIWLRSRRSGRWSEPVAVTTGGGDIYKCAVAVDADGDPWVFWSENKNWPNGNPPNFEIWASRVRDGKPSPAVQLSDDPGPDLNPVAAADPSGRLWVAWQGARDGVFQILERHETAGGAWSPVRNIGSRGGSCWSPAIAASPRAGGPIAVAWDTYEKGDYDVWVREFDAGGADTARPVASSTEFEAVPDVAYDREGRLWIAWETSGALLGKDWGAHDMHKGIPLYRDRQIAVRVLERGEWFEPAGSLAAALPNTRPERGPIAPPPRPPSRIPHKKAEPAPADAYNNFARLARDAEGRMWVFARTRDDWYYTALGTPWLTHAAYYDGDRWVGPFIVPNSDNVIDNPAAAVADPAGGLLVAYATDYRQGRNPGPMAGRMGTGSPAILVTLAPADALEGTTDPFNSDVFVARVQAAGAVAAPKLVRVGAPPRADKPVSDDTLSERADVARVRAFRTDFNGATHRIVRGEFHRHTAISMDGADDGSLEDMWRYGIDIAATDWLGCADHESGLAREFPWWVIEKTVDAYRLPGKFEPPFGYERSVNYPEGHRNVVFAQRGIRTLQRLPRTTAEKVESAPDTQMLYRYLRHFRGVAAAHTSASNAGTDWRDHAPDVEPMVEIYQGARHSFERPGAPRAPFENDVIGGWYPLGFVSNALLKGHKLAFAANSDHHSTHISFTMAYVREHTREALLDAMRRRHVYAATDNIIADCRVTANDRDYLFGDEFTTATPPTFRLKLIGTALFKKITLIKDDREVHVASPNQREVELTWTDPSPTPGKTSYYYFRGEQVDEELVWVSPMWITYSPKP